MSPPQRLTRAEIGAFGEQLAVDYLLECGLDILDRNWRCRWGEIDVIAQEYDGCTGSATVVFVEVKTRTGDGFGGVEQAVTDAKMRRLRRLAGVWLGEQQAGWSAIRLDVIGIRMRRGREPELSHIRAVG